MGTVRFIVPVAVLAAAAILAPAGAHAAEVYGKVWLAGGKVAAGAAVTITERKPDATAREAEVDGKGSYRRTGLTTGWHDVQVTYAGGKSRSLRIFVKERTPANLELVKSDDESYAWILRRRG